MKFTLRQLRRISTWAALSLGSALLMACAQHAMSNTTSNTTHPAASEQLHAFPAALAGHQRHVIELPALADEDTHKLELIGGKLMQVDCNLHGMDGSFDARNVEGWGYTYWVLQSQGQVRSTMMACAPDSKHEAFVAAQSVLIDYNSKLPVVVFAPEGMTLRWRVWSAGETQSATTR